MKHPQTELLMTVQVTLNEVIAMTAAVGFYRTYGKALTRHHSLFCLLLDQYLNRLYIEVQRAQQGGRAC